MRQQILNFVKSGKQSAWIELPGHKGQVFLRTAKRRGYSDKLVGYRDVLEIGNVQIHTLHQRKGVFTEVLRHVLDIAFRLDFDAVRIENVMNEQLALKFTKLGWRRVDLDDVLPSFEWTFVEEGSFEQELDRIAREKKINILFACESGSRAWGFASNDSDYDVRFVYQSTRNQYMIDTALRPFSKLSEEFRGREVDNLTFPVQYRAEFGAEVDTAGWNITKVCGLLRNSNPQIFEWLQSPIQYIGRVERTLLYEMAMNFWNKDAAVEHYLSLMRKSLGTPATNTTQIGIKPYLYAIRSAMSAKRATCGVVPEVSIHTLAGALRSDNLLGDQEFEELQDLLVQKQSGTEVDEVQRTPALDYMLEQMRGHHVKHGEFQVPRHAYEDMLSYLEHLN